LSQYPSPYPPQQPQQPPWYGGPPQSPEDLRAPARRAGILMIVLGVLGVIAGLCMAGFSAFIGSGQAATDPQFREMQAQIQEIESKAGVSAQTIFLVMGTVPLAVGALMGGLGFFVRGGGLVPVVLAMVLDGLLVLMFVFFVLAGLIQGAAGGNAQLLLGTVCMYGIPLVMVILLFVWLIQALRASSKIELARQHQQGQMWRYQQQQQAYRQPGAGPLSGQGPAPGQGPVQGPGWPTAPPPTSSGGYHGYPGPQYPAPPPPAAPSQSPAVTPPPPAPPSPPAADSGDRADGTPPQG
jgi:type II secretory pathway pseudopilin PulG